MNFKPVEAHQLRADELQGGFVILKDNGKGGYALKRVLGVHRLLPPNIEIMLRDGTIERAKLKDMYWAVAIG